MAAADQSNTPSPPCQPGEQPEQADIAGPLGQPNKNRPINHRMPRKQKKPTMHSPFSALECIGLVQSKGASSGCSICFDVEPVTIAQHFVQPIAHTSHHSKRPQTRIFSLSHALLAQGRGFEANGSSATKNRSARCPKCGRRCPRGQPPLRLQGRRTGRCGNGLHMSNPCACCMWTAARRNMSRTIGFRRRSPGSSKGT